MKDSKPAKLAGREKFTGFIENEDVAIEYLEIITSDTVTGVTSTELVRTNHGVIEVAGAGAQAFIGYDRAKLEQHIVAQEEQGLDMNLHSLIGINYARFSFPILDARLVLPEYVVSE